MGTHVTTWQERHYAALAAPRGPERSIVALMEGMDKYLTHSHLDIRRDYVLGESFGQILEGFIGLLNGETGRLDCGSLDTWARTCADQIGYDLDRSQMREGL